VRDAVLGNCQIIVSFRVGANDAPIISEALGCEPQGLMELGLGHALYRTLLNGQLTSALTMQRKRADLAIEHLAANIRNSPANYARPRAMVEKAAPPKTRRSHWG
jgi:hypothetical protein